MKINILQGCRDINFIVNDMKKSYIDNVLCFSIEGVNKMRRFEEAFGLSCEFETFIVTAKEKGVIIWTKDFKITDYCRSSLDNCDYVLFREFLKGK